MSYSDLLRDIRWQKKRLEVFSAAGWECEICGKGESHGVSLQVHHKRYRRGAMPWEYAREELIALCDKCHAEEHGRRETDVALQACYQAMADAHRRGDWNMERLFALEGMAMIENGAFYRGLV